MNKKIVSGLLAGVMAFSVSTAAFAAESSIPHAFGSGGDVTQIIGSDDFNKGPYDGNYHAKDGSALVISGTTLTWNRKSFSTYNGEALDGTQYAYGGAPDDFKTADGIYGTVYELNFPDNGEYAFHPFMNKSGTGIIVVKMKNDPNSSDYYQDSNKEWVVPDAVAYTKDGTVAVIAPTKNYKIDTGAKLTVKSGKTYQFKITASSKPTFACGSGSVFKVTYTGSKEHDYFFKATAVGKAGQATGFYVNGEKVPCTVATVA